MAWSFRFCFPRWVLFVLAPFFYDARVNPVYGTTHGPGMCRCCCWFSLIWVFPLIYFFFFVLLLFFFVSSPIPASTPSEWPQVRRRWTPDTHPRIIKIANREPKKKKWTKKVEKHSIQLRYWTPSLRPPTPPVNATNSLKLGRNIKMDIWNELIDYESTTEHGKIRSRTSR